MEASARREERDVIAFGALLAFAVVMYSVPGEWISWARPLRLALVTAALAAGLAVVRRVGKLEAFSFDGLRGMALLGFAALALASAAWSVHPEVSQGTAVELWKLVAIYLTLVNVVSSWRRIRLLCAAMVLASAAASIGVIQAWASGLQLVEGYRARWVGVYADPNHMAMDVGLVVPLAAAFLARKSSGWLFRLACGAAAALAVAAVVLSHSRGGFIGLAAAMAIWAMRERHRVKALALALILVTGLFTLAPESFWRRNQTVASFEADPSAMGRVFAWYVASRISLDRPLLGVGAGAFRYAWPLYAPPEARRAYVAHNVFLDVVGELGWAGMLFFLAFVGAAVGGAFQASPHPENGWLARAVAASVAGYLVCALFSGYILSTHLYVLFGLGACVERVSRAEEGEACPTGA
ncbi:MAG: O-antigen ligase family protein [Myxococcales bacterium]|nr:O-antigen ligase family protein [Myxococcales bacterium]